jgi:chromosomal replication initiation ATPase DnaA
MTIDCRSSSEAVKPHERPLAMPSADCFLVAEETTFSIVGVNVSEQQQQNDRKRPLYADCGGLEKEIETLKEFFVYPFERLGLYKSIGVEMSKGVLLYGASGCGKTMLARATCNEAKCAVVELNIAQVFSKNYGETEEKLKKFFADAWLKFFTFLFFFMSFFSLQISIRSTGFSLSLSFSLGSFADRRALYS